MALEDVLKEKYLEIDERGDSDKRVVFYFGDLIGLNYGVLSDIFSPIIDKQFKENLKYMVDEIKEKGFTSVELGFFANRLYVEVSDMVEELSSEESRTIGTVIYGAEENTPDVQFGLSKYFRSRECNIAFLTKGLTKKGVDVVNSYRKAKGLSLLEE